MTRITYPFSGIQQGVYLYSRPDWVEPRIVTVTVEGEKTYCSFAIDIEKHPTLMKHMGEPWMEKSVIECCPKDAYFQTPAMRVQEEFDAQKNSNKLMEAFRVAMGVLEAVRAEKPELIADNVPSDWGMNRLRDTLVNVKPQAEDLQKMIDAANGVLFLFPSQDYPDSIIGGMALKNLEDTIKEVGGELRRPRGE